MSSWSRDEVKELKKVFSAVHHEYPGISKNEKWGLVAERMGGRKTKRQCHDKYKELLDARAREKEHKRRSDSKGEDEDGGLDEAHEFDGRPPTAGSNGRSLMTGHGRGGSGSSTAGLGGRARALSDSLSSAEEPRPPPSREAPDKDKGPTQHAPATTTQRGSIRDERAGRRRSSSGEEGEGDEPAYVAEMKGGLSNMGMQDKAHGSSNRAPAPPSGWGSGGKGKGHKGTSDEITIEDCDDLDPPPPAPPSSSSSSSAGWGKGKGASSSAPAPRTHTSPAPPSSSSSSSYSYSSSSAYNPSAFSGGGGRGGGESRGAPLTPELAMGLRRLLFGEPGGRFNTAWLQQDFVFSRYDDLGFGLVQHKGGPCGVLAVVQALLLAHLLHPSLALDSQECRSPEGEGWRNPKEGARRASLAWAISAILWRAGGGEKAVLALPGDSPGPIVGVKADGVTERLQLYTFDKQQALHSFVSSRLERFLVRGQGGVVALTYSAMLSRTLDSVKADADEALGGATLIDRHGYATQELVNLLLIGRAHSNVFDGTRTLDDHSGKSDDAVTLRGIPSRGLVGFLSLHEAYRYTEVGAHFKSPQAPVWVVCSESHYSCLFLPPGAPPTPETAEQLFELHYYDGLSNQQESIVLTIDRLPLKPPPSGPDDDRLIPPLDLVVRTKWPGAAVRWSGDPIL